MQHYSYHHGAWELNWREAPRTTGTVVSHELLGFHQKQLVFEDRVQQVGFRGTRSLDVASDLLQTIRLVTRDGTRPRLISGSHATVSTFYPSFDGVIGMYTSSWSQARLFTEGSSVDATGATLYASYYYDGASAYIAEHVFLRFDTSNIGADDISDAVLSLYCVGKDGTDTYNDEVRAIGDFGTLEVADYPTGAEYAALTLLAEKAHSSWVVGQYNEFTNVSGGAPMIAHINKTGNTHFILSTNPYATTDTNPTSRNYYDVSSVEEEISGGSQRPKLVITHESPGGGGGTGTVFQNYRRQRWG
jgi:hypothetical protein